MNDKLAPEDRLLPEFSILEKIEALKPGSAANILDRSEEVTKSRITDTRPYRRPKFWQLPNPSSDMNHGWAATGDDLRAAINAYIKVHGLESALSLTDKERQSLDYVALDHTRDNTRPDVPLFKKNERGCTR